MTLSIIAPIRVKLYQCPETKTVHILSPGVLHVNRTCRHCGARLLEAGPSQKIDVLVFPEVAKDLMALDRAEREAEPKKKGRGMIR
jgi:hypothetical protein